MKKKILVCLCVCASPFFLGVGSSFAADATSSQAAVADGGLVTIGTDATQQLKFSPSPHVSVVVACSTTSHGIMTTNMLTNKDNGLEYGTVSSATGYAQRIKTVDPDTAVPTPSATALASGTWTWMGGSGS